MNWKIQTPTIPTTTEELIQLVLQTQGVEEIEVFLHPVSPLELSAADVGLRDENLAAAVERLEQALQEEELVMVFGDYDCDGVCATTVLWETLYELGFNVKPFIPERDAHGYGISDRAIDALLQKEKPALVISVDNGITAHKPIARLRQLGIDVIVTDHHEPESTLPDANVILHTTALCGTTVAWMLARELNPEKAATMLDLCAVATIADQVPLMGPNRSFAKFGLEALAHTTRPGLIALLQIAGVDPMTVDERTINFAIAPRINAAGRLGSALDALRTLCARSLPKALERAQLLEASNLKRQTLTKDLVDLARSQVLEWKDDPIVIVADRAFHEGVIGLIASKLTEELGKPTIVLSVGETHAKGSARSVKGIHITEFLRRMRDDLIELGGHPMAAGLKLSNENIEQFKSHARALSHEHLGERTEPEIAVALELPSSLMTLETALALEQLRPFGASNQKPLFALRKVNVVGKSLVGKEGNHLKLTIAPDASQLERVVPAMYFHQGELLESIGMEPLDIVSTLEINEWKGRVSLQLIVSDVLC